MIDPINKLALLGELEGANCVLKHEDEEPRKACDYLVCPMGRKESDIVDVIEDYITIPICEDCMDALQGDEWILFYCLSCGESQWMLRKLARRYYTLNNVVIWMPECPKCGK